MSKRGIIRNVNTEGQSQRNMIYLKILEKEMGQKVKVVVGVGQMKNILDKHVPPKTVSVRFVVSRGTTGVSADQGKTTTTITVAEQMLGR